LFFPSGACRQKRNDDKLVNTFIALDNGGWGIKYPK